MIWYIESSISKYIASVIYSLIYGSNYAVQTIERVSVNKEGAGGQYSEFICTEFSTRGLWWNTYTLTALGTFRT